MHISTLTARSFRNYDSLQIDFSPGVNIIVGANAQGKTNLLEGVHFLATGRSHRVSRDGELVRWGRDWAFLRGEITAAGGERSIEAQIPTAGRKSIKVNGTELRRLSDLFGLFQIVMFTPDDLQLIKGSPGLRRRYLDMQICQISPLYRHYLQRYNQVLRQRNKLLERRDKKSLPVWDGQLVQLGSAVIRYRRKAVEVLSRFTAAHYRTIAGEGEEMGLAYQPFWAREGEHPPWREDEVEGIFHGQIELLREDELRRGQTLVGPQRDDLVFTVADRPAKSFASQGQQRSCVLACKLAELDYIHRESGEYPVLLLDDVASELDDERRAQLFAGVPEGVQLLLTTTSLSPLMPMLAHGQVFSVADGIIRKEGKGGGQDCFCI
ncbi:MAG: DNA replication/repair protein RecF [Limnochordia bacterium]|nr:DNA replication/repair protein RecF [Bacillota bacterium]